MLFFRDTVDGYHYSLVVCEDGSTQNMRAALPFISGAKCQMSYAGDDNAEPRGKTHLPEQRAMKVYLMGIGHGFERGDWIVVRRKGIVIYEGTIGDPRTYDRGIIHTELALNSYSGAVYGNPR